MTYNVLMGTLKLNPTHSLTLPLQGLEPVGGKPLMSVTRGQCNARLTVTFPAARHHRYIGWYKLYCLVTEAYVC